MKALNWEPGNEELERCLKRAKDVQCESYWDKLVVEHNVCFHMDACCHAMVNMCFTTNSYIHGNHCPTHYLRGL